jgi:nucleoside-diphosphate-sugar epimerase
VLDRLLKEGYPVSVTYRREEQVKVYKDLGVTPVKADLEDAARIEEVVSQYEVLINTASSDHPKSVEASIKGIQRRVDKGEKTIYIHTSGTGAISDAAGGRFKSDTIFEDDKPEMMDGVDDGAPHRAIDKNLARKAAKWHKAGLAEVRILLPPLIFGYGSGPFKKHSQQIPTIITSSLKAGAALCHGPVGLSPPNPHELTRSRDWLSGTPLTFKTWQMPT